MKITKYVHSCILIENDNDCVLFDPGVYSTGLIDVKKLPGNLSTVVITHEHADHMDVEFLKKLMKERLGLTLLTTKAAKAKLEAEGLSNIFDQAPENFEVFSAPHEDVSPIGKPPENIGVHYRSMFTHPGDSHSFNESKKILALPTTAPWGYMANAARLGSLLKPEIIIPIHDWHWKKEALNGMYERLKEFFLEQGITFIIPVDGKPIEVK